VGKFAKTFSHVSAIWAQNAAFYYLPEIKPRYVTLIFQKMVNFSANVGRN
jgi:hypothetical protein